MIVGVIYKPPNFSNPEFLDKLERTLHNVFLSKKKCILMGDTNINTLTKTSVSKEYINLIQSEGFSQLIFEATSITENSQSCIDHIFTNISTSCSSGSLAVEIADHLPVFTILYDPKFSPFPDYFEFRDFRSFEDENFKLDLRRESWDSIYKCNEVNESYTRFLHIFNKVSNIHAPLKKAKIKHKAYKPWITSGLKKSMKVRDKLYKKWLITRNYVSEIEVFLLLESLDTNKSFGIDKIHPLLLKTAALQIYRAKVTVPICKQGSRFACSNYRPISVLSSISKIFERCIFNQLMFYFTNNNMISAKQYGFRPGFTTSDCLIDLIEEITSSLDKGLYVVSLFLDLSKAFDTVNHQILLNKLKYYGLQQSEYNWFQSYLNNRKQQVHANSVASDTRFISTGVPQGSILGLCCLLFSLMTFQSLPPFFLPDYMQTIHL